MLAAIQSLGNFAASALVGILWSAAGPRVAFVYVTVCMVVSLGAINVTSRSAAIQP